MSIENETNQESSPSCCPPEPTSAGAAEPANAKKKRNLGTWATAGSFVSAVLASACCWLPLVAVAFGASAAGVGAVFDEYRPYFLAIATVLLGAGFYFLYVRKEACEPGSACAVPNVKSQRFSRAMFWVAVVFIGAFAFFPNYVGYLLGGTSSGNVVAVQGQREVHLDLEGMTCEGCAATITAALQKVDGVAGVNVDYATKRARVTLTNTSLADDPTPLIRAVEGSGYKAKLIASGQDPGGLVRKLTIEGMTCEACAAGIRGELAAVPGVTGVDVSYEQGLATVRLKPQIETSVDALVAAIKKAGYRGFLQDDSETEVNR
jgi:copper chaperone CopZ